jgi:hypothetical protein
MKFTIKELIAGVVNSNLSEEDKIELLTRISTTAKIVDGFYLKKGEDGLLEFWFRNEDEYGTTEHGPTNFDVEQVISEFARSVNKARNR